MAGDLGAAAAVLTVHLGITRHATPVHWPWYALLLHYSGEQAAMHYDVWRKRRGEK